MPVALASGFSAGTNAVAWRRATRDFAPAVDLKDAAAPQIRRLVFSVDLVGSRRIWPAHVGCLVDPDGSRRVLLDRLDDQPDDQAGQSTG
jgi:hypothetical protein